MTDSWLPMQIGLGNQTNATAVSEGGTVVGGQTSFGSRVFIHTGDDGVIDVLILPQ